MTASGIKNAVLAALAAAGAWLADALGGWDALLQVLVAMMAADYVTGLIVAGLFHRSPKSDGGALDSHAGFKGLAKKCAVLLLVFLAVMLDRAAGAHYVRSAVVIFFIGNEGLSVLENIGLMGVPYPAFLRNMLEALRKKGDEGSTDCRVGPSDLLAMTEERKSDANPAKRFAEEEDEQRSDQALPPCGGARDTKLVRTRTGGADCRVGPSDLLAMTGKGDLEQKNKTGAQRSGSGFERTSSEASETASPRAGEGYGACEDEGGEDR